MVYSFGSNILYIDLTFLFLIYAFASIALGVSVYALWTLKEVEEQFRNKKSKPNNAWDHYHDPKNQTKSKSKGHFDNIYR